MECVMFVPSPTPIEKYYQKKTTQRRRAGISGMAAFFPAGFFNRDFPGWN